MKPRIAHGKNIMKKADEESRLDRIEKGLELLLQSASELRESQK